MLNITDILSFQKFLKLCAARTGNIINYASLARDCDIAPHTAKAWLSILEASYIIKLLPPYYKNYNKRLIKNPKLYFCDPGLASFLLGINNPQELYTHPLRGALFETFMISELYKYYYNIGRVPPLYFWRDTQGHEIDCIIEKSYETITAIEIKSSMTIMPGSFKELIHWQGLTHSSQEQSILVYAGVDNQTRTHGRVITWDSIETIF